ncbi:DUF11 domain-containing protein [Futiania mangrovi]|uniref:Choice-of-anchor L domain-containing protein n=1 Tax=Futiania mangrovi TaxID=2959716 RepID=A0A9J6PCG1_9PROT|nr:DUF11 domain-containing protein [Futiania mangrovii]MCP1336249.1 choice-of-anchor L domain-containing protein [Futiania mangrovii]
MSIGEQRASSGDGCGILPAVRLCVRALACGLGMLSGMLAGTGGAAAQLAVDDAASTAQMQAALTGPNITLQNLSAITGAAHQYGIFTGGASANRPGAVVGIADGLFLSTGAGNQTAPDRLNNAAGPHNTILGANSGGGVSYDNGRIYFDADLRALDLLAVYDPAILQVDATPQGNILQVRFVYAGEDYPEYVCSQFRDVFGIFVTGVFTPGGAEETRNLALVPGTNTPVSINSVNPGQPGQFGSAGNCPINNTALYVDNGDGSRPNQHRNLQFDGLTLPITAQTQVVPGQTYRIKLAIADSVDRFWDSAVFIDEISSSAADPADLSLTLAAAIQPPAIGESVPVTVTVSNAGPGATSGVGVSVAVPAGLTLLGHDGGPAYASGTGLWTVGTLAAGGSATLTLHLAAERTGPHAVEAEIVTSSAFDPDSTPGNAVAQPGEDDSATLDLTPLPESTAALPAPVCGLPLDALEWRNTNWPRGDAAASFTKTSANGGDPVTFDFAFTGATGLFTNNRPDDTWSTRNGEGGAYRSLDVWFDPPDKTQDHAITLTITLSRPIADLRFTLFDLDRAFEGVERSRVEAVEVTGSSAGGAVAPVLRAVGVSAAATGNRAFGLASVATAANNVEAAFPAPVDSVTIVFRSADTSPGNPDRHDLALGTIFWCAETLSQAALTVAQTVEVYDPGVLGLKALPGTDMLLTIRVENAGPGATDTDSVVLVGAVPPDVMFFNGDMDDAGPETGPVAFVDAGSGLVCCGGPGDLAYSDGSPTVFTYVPQPGYDPQVRYIRFHPKGAMAGNGGTPPAFELRYRAQVR